MLILTALVLTGCASAQAAESPYAAFGPELSAAIEMWEQDAPASQAQRDELSDGEVTEAEVQSAFERYRSCLRSAGHELRDIAYDGPLINAGVPDAAVDSGDDARCYASEYAGVDVVWQVSNSGYSHRYARVANCLSDNQLSVPNVALPTVADMERVLAEAGISLGDCAEVRDD